MKFLFTYVQDFNSVGRSDNRPELRTQGYRNVKDEENIGRVDSKEKYSHQDGRLVDALADK
jgi:hypothetical protein